MLIIFAHFWLLLYRFILVGLVFPAGRAFLCAGVWEPTVRVTQPGAAFCMPEYRCSGVGCLQGALGLTSAPFAKLASLVLLTTLFEGT